MRPAPSTCVLCVLLGALGAACTASSEDVRPPSDELFFPSGVQVSPDESVLFVANGNSELRYDSGTLSVIDLNNVENVAKSWTGSKTTPDGCSPDVDFTETLICDESPFINGDASVRIGNFATDVGLQSDPAQPAHLRLFVPTRGDPSIAWADYRDGALSCSDEAKFGLCDDAHRLTTPKNDPDVGLSAIPDEPFGVFVDSANGYAFVTHQTTGSLSLIDSPINENAEITDIRHNIFSGDVLTGLSGATSVTGRIGANNASVIYVGARTEDRVQTFTVVHPDERDPNTNQFIRYTAPPYLVSSEFFFLDSVGNGSGVGNSSDTRGMVMTGDGNRLYMVNRAPPSVQVYDTSIGPDGSPRNTPVTATDVCRNASTLAVVDAGDGERAYTTCFQDGLVYVVNANSGQAEVEDIFTVGRGPYAIAVAKNKKKLFISNFLEDTIAVVDIDPASKYRNRVVLRIGVPRVTN